MGDADGLANRSNRSTGGDSCRGGKGSESSHSSDLTDGSRVSRGGVRRPVFMLWIDGRENDVLFEGMVSVADIINRGLYPAYLGGPNRYICYDSDHSQEALVMQNHGC